MRRKIEAILSDSDREKVATELLELAARHGYKSGDEATSLAEFFSVISDGNLTFIRDQRATRLIKPDDKAIVGAVRAGSATLGYLLDGDGLAVDALQVLINATFFRVDFPEIEVPPDFPRKK